MNPDNLSLHELAHYGLQSDDPWVRRLSNTVYELTYFMKDENIDEGYLDEHFDNIKYKVESAEEDAKAVSYRLSDTEESLEKANERIKSLQYDLDRDAQEQEIRTLKARLHEKNIAVVRLEEKLKETQRLLTQLAENHHALVEKHNTWTTIATP